MEQIEQKKIQLGVSGYEAIVQKKENVNLTLLIVGKGAVGIFRIHFNNLAKKNIRHDDLLVLDVYFEGFPVADTAYSGSSNLSNVTDLCIFVERKRDWILNYVMRELR
jgi:hypothetical protein